MLRSVLLLILIAPSAGAVALGPYAAVLDYHNRDHDCVNELCLFSVDGEGGDTTVDARQEFTFVGVYVDASVVDHLARHDLLPDAALRFDLASMTIDQPVYRLLVEEVGTVQGPGMLREFRLRFAEDGVTVHATRHVDHATDFPGPTAYEQIGPFDEIVAPTSTDATASAAVADACAVDESGQCAPVATDADEQRKAHTPEILVGLDVDAADVTTESRTTRYGPILLTSPRARAEAPSGIGARGTGGAALPELPPALASIPLLPVTHAPAGVERALPPNAPKTPEGTPPIRTAGVETAAPMRDATLRVIAVASAVAIAALLASLYSRINGRTDALRSERRARIIALLTERGPTPVAELARILEVDRTTIEHHVRLLRRTTQVVVRRHARQTLVALPGQEMPEESPFAGSQAAEVIVAILGANGGSLTRQDLHRLAADLPLRTRNHTLKQLAELGVIVREVVDGAERVVLARPTP